MNAPTTAKLARHAQELREAVDQFNQREWTLATVTTLVQRVQVIADRMAVNPDRKTTGVVMDLGDFSRKVVG